MAQSRVAGKRDCYCRFSLLENAVGIRWHFEADVSADTVTGSLRQVMPFTTMEKRGSKARQPPRKLPRAVQCTQNSPTICRT